MARAVIHVLSGVIVCTTNDPSYELSEGYIFRSIPLGIDLSDGFFTYDSELGDFRQATEEELELSKIVPEEIEVE